MAIYHLSAQVISRSGGRSATAAAAYRSAERLEDERTGETHDYTRKRGVNGTEIIAPDHAPAWMRDRSTLWNGVEQSEQRKDAQVAREFDVALPKELDHDQKRELVRGFVRDQFTRQGMVADIAYHHFDGKNPHAHILLTTRNIEGDRFGKKNRDWNKKDLLNQQREAWAVHVNRSLDLAGCTGKKVDHRTLEAQGINRVPQIHKGPNVHEMHRRGLKTDRGDKYDAIAQTNEELERIENQIVALKRQKDAQRQTTPTAQSVHKATREAMRVSSPPASPSRSAVPPKKPQPQNTAPSRNAPLLHNPLPQRQNKKKPMENSWPLIGVIETITGLPAVLEAWIWPSPKASPKNATADPPSSMRCKKEAPSTGCDPGNGPAEPWIPSFVNRMFGR